MRYQQLLAPILSVSIAVPAVAAQSDGTLGPTSNGTFQVSATISAPAVDNVQITGLDDVVFTGTTDGGDLPQELMTFCMIRQPGGGEIGVTMSSIAAGDSSFLVRSSATGETIPLTIALKTMNTTYSPLSEGLETTFSVPSSCSEVAFEERSEMSIFLDDADGSTPSNLVAGTFANTFLISIAPK